jgi:hypothetical protein
VAVGVLGTHPRAAHRASGAGPGVNADAAG